MSEPLLVALIVFGYVLALFVAFVIIVTLVQLCGPLLDRYLDWVDSIAKRIKP